MTTRNGKHVRLARSARAMRVARFVAASSNPAVLTHSHLEGDAMQLHIERDDPTLWLYNVDGIARLHGYDTDGNTWTEYTLEPFDDGPMTDECADCGAEITSGWLCLDGGETICSSHVVIVTRKD